MDTSKGIIVNIALPLVIFWAIMGFEMLSGVLENPLGNDETDMNVYEKIHALEGNAEQIFNVTETRKAALHHCLLKTECLVMQERQTDDHIEPVRHHRADPSRAFRTYFRWVPVPTAVLGDMMDSHGEVENIHQLWMTFKNFFFSFSVRDMLRNSLYRTQGGRIYEAVSVEDGSRQTRPVQREQPPVDFNKDPNYFCHYLEFVGASDLVPPEEQVGDGCSIPQQ